MPCHFTRWKLVTGIAALALRATLPAAHSHESARLASAERASSPPARTHTVATDDPSRPRPTRAASSEEFLSSLGVVTHVDQGYDAERYVEPLRYTGIRNIRDAGQHLESTIMLHRRTGVRVNLLGGGDVEGVLATARTLAANGALLSLEGPNEPNNFPITYKGEKGGGFCPACTWVPVARFQKDLYDAAKRDPVLRHYPIFAVSEAGAEVDNVGLQFLTIPKDAGTKFPDGTVFADYANPHNYVIGTAKTYEDNQAWKAADPTLNGHWDGLYSEYGVTWFKHYPGYRGEELEALPRVTTETGWDSVSDPGGEHVQGVVLVNTYLAQFKRGWRYTFIYELVDGQGSTGNQGLVRPDFTLKPAATYIHNLTAILSGGSPSEAPDFLSYGVPKRPETVHDLLLQKNSHTFDLVIWGERTDGMDDVLVQFGGKHRSIDVYDVTESSIPVRSLTDVDAVPLTLSDHALILEISD